MTISDVEQLEERLQSAMLAGDADALNDLISDRLVFVALDGTNVDKETDLSRHRTGTLRLKTLAPLEPRQIEFCGEDVALVNVATEVAGTFADTPFSGHFRYTRTWHREKDGVRIVAGQVCVLQRPLD